MMVIFAIRNTTNSCNKYICEKNDNSLFGKFIYDEKKNNFCHIYWSGEMFIILVTKIFVIRK